MPYPSDTLYPSAELFPGGTVPETAEAPGAPSLTPHGATEKLQPGRYMLRHIAPLALSEGEPGVFNPLGAGFAVLGQTLYADPLPQLRLPTSPDWHEGKYTLRVLDAQDFMLGFPNRDASDGRPWRSRFNMKGHKEWVEISREGEVEFVGVLVKSSIDRQKVTLEGYDGLFLLKKAFEQEWVGVMGPRDLIERYSGLNVATLAALPPTEAGWEASYNGAGTSGHAEFREEEVSMGARLSTFETTEPVFLLASRTSFTEAPGPWSARVELRVQQLLGARAALQFGVGPPGSFGAYITLQNNTASLNIVASGAGTSIPIKFAVGAYTLLLQCDGRWISAYVNGQLIGVLGGYVGSPGGTRVRIAGVLPPLLPEGKEDELLEVAVTEVVAKDHKPFLMRGPEKGQYVLPGTAATYPTGGLHGRYAVSGDTGPAWYQSALAPDPRRSGYPEFIQGQGLPNTEPAAVPAGVPVSYFSVRYFGAIYLQLSKGDYTVQLNRGKAGVAMRAWVGKTQFTDLLIDDWNPLSGTVGVAATVSAAALGGRDGWYPIIVEFAVETGAVATALEFVAPHGYRDPGGTFIFAGVGTVVPITSLSPLGCVDARIQGSSFFDIVQETAKNFGYQLRCEPRQLESGEFPGRIIPTSRLGKDTDEIIEAGDIDRRSEVNNYTATEDATDTATSLKAFGAGIADGKGSQIAFEALSVSDAVSSLFDLEAWLSAGDIAFPQLLVARASAELGLRLGPWQNIEGEPVARDRLSDTFPLTGVLSQFHWLPGDGVRLRLPDVNIEDTVPRQILQITRNFSPDGRTGTSVGFRARPKDPLYAVRTALRDATRPARAYQHQYTSRVSEKREANPAAGAFTLPVALALTAIDQVIGAELVITLTKPVTTAIEINGVDRTALLGGPWAAPVTISILPYATPKDPVADQQLRVRLQNTGGVENTGLHFQLILTLLV